LKYKFSAAFFKITVALPFYVFIVLDFDTTIIDKIGSVTDQNYLAVLYSATIAIVGLGVILFPISKVFLRSENGQTKYLPIVIASSTAFLLFLSVLIFSSTLPLIVFSTFFSALNLGYLGGWMFWSMSTFLNGPQTTG